MSAFKIVAIVLVVLGLLALAYGGFTYTRQTHDVNLGPLHMSVQDRETVNIPLWVGLGAVVAGALLFVAGEKKLIRA